MLVMAPRDDDTSIKNRHPICDRWHSPGPVALLGQPPTQSGDVAICSDLA